MFEIRRVPTYFHRRTSQLIMKEVTDYHINSMFSNIIIHDYVYI